MNLSQLIVVTSTQSRLSGASLITVDNLAVLSKINPYFEHIYDGRTNRVFMDLDGKIKEKLMTLDDVSILTRSHYKARNYDKETCKFDGTVIPKLRYRLTFIYEAVRFDEPDVEKDKNGDIIKTHKYSMDFMKIQVVHKLKKTILRELLDGIITVDGTANRNLEIDDAVYRSGKGGKMSMVNNRKFPDDTRINTLIKGTIADTIITVCPLVGKEVLKSIKIYDWLQKYNLLPKMRRL